MNTTSPFQRLTMPIIYVLVWSSLLTLYGIVAEALRLHHHALAYALSQVCDGFTDDSGKGE